jgi:NADPH:quinone reductase-like Zn-dependent oxidoreductase
MASGHACRADHPLRRPEVLDVVDVPEPTPGPGQQLYDISTAGANYADTHHPLSTNTLPEPQLAWLRL